MKQNHELKLVKRISGSLVYKMEEVYRPPVKNLMFGQFLVEKKKITQDDLFQSLKVQSKEKGDLKTSHRLLGTIIMDDLGLIKNRVELQRLLKEFEEYKDLIESQHDELRSLKGGKHE